VDARYVGQGFELTVPVPGAGSTVALARVRASFRRDLRAATATRSRASGRGGEWKLSASRRHPREPRKAADTPAPAPQGSPRRTSGDGRLGRLPIYDRTSSAGMQIRAAIVEERESTSVLRPA